MDTLKSWPSGIPPTTYFVRNSQDLRSLDPAKLKFFKTEQAARSGWEGQVVEVRVAVHLIAVHP
jgi:hypothetical protein